MIGIIGGVAAAHFWFIYNVIVSNMFINLFLNHSFAKVGFLFCKNADIAYEVSLVKSIALFVLAWY
jgi:hypothetical protein